MTEQCCSTYAYAEPLSEVLESAADDPALQSCCARDLKQQAYAARLKGELLARDKTTARLEIAARTFNPHLNLLPDAEAREPASDGEPRLHSIESGRESAQ